MGKYGDIERAWESAQEAAYDKKMSDADREADRLEAYTDEADSEIQGSPELLDEALSEYLEHKADSASYDAWTGAIHRIYSSYGADRDAETVLLLDLRTELDKAVAYYADRMARERIDAEDANVLEP